MAESWRVKVRDGAKVRTSTHAALSDALDVLQAETAEAANRPAAKGVDLKVRSFAPGDRIVMRAEVSGPQRFMGSVKAGVDVRGDGRLVPWVGGRRRTEVEARRNETVWQALRRELGAD